GASLTMASIAVLPVLLGLAVDYAIQFQSRVTEAGGDVRAAAALGGPTILTAGAATAAGFLVLALSPVPMVRGFGLLLVLRIVLASAAPLPGGVAALVLTRGRPVPGPLQAMGGRLARALHGAEDLLLASRPAAAAGRRAGALGRGALQLSITRPGRVLGVALA